MINYVPSPTGLALHNSNAFVKMICGPYGSGKSCACAMDVLITACAQAPAPDKTRYVRVGVIRATYPELQSTTRKSLMEVLPDECGTILSAGAPLRGLYVIPLPDGTKVQLELQLVSLENESAYIKIMSANWTYAWLNEAAGLPETAMSVIMSRIGRYPSQSMGGVSWGGVLMDFNQPVVGSWLDKLCNDHPDNYAYFRQPPACFKVEKDDGTIEYETNPQAENLWNLGAREEGDPETFETEEEHREYLVRKGLRYYRNQIDSLLRTGRNDIVDAMYAMLPVAIIDGKPVYPAFRINKHVSAHPLSPEPYKDIIVGMDTSGIHPAAVIIQFQREKWCILDEIYMEGEGLENFLHAGLIPILRERYANCPVVCAVDPSNPRDSYTAITPRQRLEELGITTVSEISNSPKARIQAVEHLLNLDVGGLLVNKDCQMTVRGFVSEYRYRKLRSTASFGTAYTPVPEKNEYSHVHDAIQYACLVIQSGFQEQNNDIAGLSERLQQHRAELGRLV